MAKRTVLLLCLPLLGAGACRGGVSKEPPIHLQRNMFTQDKGKPQRENSFFADHRTQRPPVPGTVHSEALDPNDPRMTGRDGDGKLVAKVPVPVTMDVMQRGQNRYEIYCAPCHDRTGYGEGVVWQRANGALVKPTSYHEDRLRGEADGHFFDVITNGVRTMQAYGHQVPPEDRWAIVAYIRALQRSQNGRVQDVPQDKRSELQ